MHGHQGCNIPTDLFVEYMNRHLKNMIGKLQSNVSLVAIQHAAKSLDVKYVCQVFQREAEYLKIKGIHSYLLFEDDFNKVMKQQKMNQ